jgi:hypothetical protein
MSDPVLQELLAAADPAEKAATLKPWRYRYWLFPRDPDFVNKACLIVDLYAGFWQGQRLGPDEKSIQILAR